MLRAAAALRPPLPLKTLDGTASRRSTADLDRLRVLDIFQANRKLPGAPFEESHFLDYLLAAPRRHGAVFWSLPGRLRLNAFTDAVQLDFGICFTRDDRRSNYPLVHYVQRVAVLRRSRRSSMSALRAQARRSWRWDAWLCLNVPSWTAFALALERSAAIAAAVAGLALLGNAGLVFTHRRGRAYRRTLEAEIRREGRQ